MGRGAIAGTAVVNWPCCCNLACWFLTRRMRDESNEARRLVRLGVSAVASIVDARRDWEESSEDRRFTAFVFFESCTFCVEA